MLTATVFVSFKDNPDIAPIKLPSNVTGEDLVNVVLNKPGFGEGSVENDEGITVTKAVPSVPDGQYVFIPSVQGDVHLHAAATNFWCGLAQVEMQDKTIQALPASPLSLVSYVESKFYVRSAYRKIWDCITRTKDPILITGTPGTGKTSMLLFILQQLSQQDCIVVVEQLSKMGRLLIEGGQVFQGLPGSFESELKSAKTWYLVDATMPLQYHARTIVTCSIDNNIYQDFEKFKALALFMPVWEWSEIEAAVEIFPEVTVDAAKELFRKFGGVVRAVLALAHLPRSETALDAALSDASPERILQQIGQPSQKGLSDRLTHVFSDETFTRHRLDFASAYVRDRLADRFIATKQTELRTFLISHTADAMEYSILWGHMFEFYTLSMLSAGTCKSFKRQNLSTGALDEMPVEQSNIFTYKDVSETTEMTRLCKPAARNESAVDAVLQPCTGLQITRNLKHHIKAQGLRSCINALKDKEHANITFCVPPSIFDHYHKQAVSGSLDLNRYPFEQYVIEIPIRL